MNGKRIVLLCMASAVLIAALAFPRMDLMLARVTVARASSRLGLLATESGKGEWSGRTQRLVIDVDGEIAMAAPLLKELRAQLTNRSGFREVVGGAGILPRKGDARLVLNVQHSKDAWRLVHARHQYHITMAYFEGHDWPASTVADKPVCPLHCVRSQSGFDLGVNVNGVVSLPADRRIQAEQLAREIAPAVVAWHAEAVPEYLRGDVGHRAVQRLGRPGGVGNHILSESCQGLVLYWDGQTTAGTRDETISWYDAKSDRITETVAVPELHARLAAFGIAIGFLSDATGPNEGFWVPATVNGQHAEASFDANSCGIHAIIVRTTEQNRVYRW